MVPKKTLWTAALLSLSLLVPLAVGASGEADSAAADDADRTVAIELMQGAWVGTPRGDDDPYRKWLNETYIVRIHAQQYARVPVAGAGQIRFRRCAGHDQPRQQGPAG